MNNINKEKDLENSKLDMKSPYIKNNIYGIDEVRKRIASRAYKDISEDNILSINKKESDTMLSEKIGAATKRIVGEEIRKFAEIAGKEIGKEFENLEIKLENKILEKFNNRLEKNTEYLEQKVYDHLVMNNDTLDKLEASIVKRIEDEILKLYTLIEEMEARIKDLELFSLSNKKVEEFINKNEEVVKENNNTEYKFEINKDEEKESVNILEEMKEVLKENKEDEDEIKEIENKEDFIKNKIKSIAKEFEKDGILFKTNIFVSKIKNLNTKKVLENNVEDISKEHKEKIENILKNIISSLKIEPEIKETIEDFIKRAYKKEYLNKK